MTFYNTTQEPDKAARDEACNEQEKTILEFMRRNRMTAYTAEDIEREFKIPRASVSRAMCNLTKRQQIRKSSSARWKSSYGRACYAWRAE